MSTNLREFLDTLKDQTAVIAQTFNDPSDDWFPAAFAKNKDGIAVIILDPAFFRDEATKDGLVQALVEKIKEDQVSAFAIQVTVYRLTTKHEPGTDLYGDDFPDDFSTHPDSVETLLVQAFDADQFISVSADIERSEDTPPKLAEWKEANGPAMGRLVEPFRDALKIARREREQP